MIKVDSWPTPNGHKVHVMLEECGFRVGKDWADYPHLKKWFDGIAARPAILRGVEMLADLRKPITTDKAREILFGNTQYQKR